MGRTAFSTWRWPVPTATFVLLVGLLWPAGAGPGSEPPWWLPEAFDACHMPALFAIGWLWGQWRPLSGGRVQLPGWKLFWIGLMIAVLLEPLQMLTGRYADPLDALANASGWTLGLALARCRSRRGTAFIGVAACVVAVVLAWPLGQHWQDRRLWAARLPVLPPPVELRQFDRWWQGYGPPDGGWGVRLLREGSGVVEVNTVSGDYSGARLRLQSLPDSWLGGRAGLAFEVRSERAADLTVRVDAERDGEPVRFYESFQADADWRSVVIKPPDNWPGTGSIVRHVSWFRGPGQESLRFEVRAVRLVR